MSGKGVFLSFMLSLFFISLVSAIQIDSEVEEQLETSSEVNVIIMLKDKPMEKMPIKKALSENKEMMIKAQQYSVLSSLEDDLKLKYRYSTINGFAGKITEEGFEKLKQDPNVDRIYIDGLKELFLDVSVPLINATKTWSLVYNGTNLTGAGETVCIIDSGIDNSHSAFTGRIKAQHCYCSLRNSDDGQFCCPDNSIEDTDASDDSGHGTHCAGIVASNNSAYRGVAPEAGIVAIKVCNSSGTCADSDIIAGIQWCTNNATKYNISVISMSLGGETYSDYCNGDSIAPSINTAVGQNISVVVAAGNDGSPINISAPACVQNATPIAATDDNDNIASFSNRNSLVELLAPGVNIYSTYIPNTFAELDGTSMATPHAAGAFALINQYIKLEGSRRLTPAEIEDALNDTGKAVSDGSYIYRRINVFAAILSLDNSPPSINFTGPTPANNSNINLSWVFINISSNEVLSSAILDWNGTNETMNGSGLNWYKNKTDLTNGIKTYRVYGYDNANNVNVSELRTLYINNTAPNITSYYPLTNISIAEPNNQTFNITYNDSNGDPVTVSWYLNQSMVSNLDNYTFIGNYSSSGTYNVTVIVSDGILTGSFEWILNVTNTNRLPNATSVLVNCSDNLNRTNGTVTGSWVYNDLDNEPQNNNETKWYNNSIEAGALANKTFIGSGNTTKHQNWTFSVRVYDGYNWSEWINSSMLTIKNAVPFFEIIQNISVNETGWANITANASDIDSDIINYSINDSRFNQSNNIFSWHTNISDSGTFHVNITVSDGFENVSQIVAVAVINQFDTDNDGIVDVNDEDDDNDGINDTSDFLKGNLTHINTTLSNINLTINNSVNLSQIFNTTLLVRILNSSDLIVEFDFNFSSTSVLDLTNMTINKNENSSIGSVIIKGINLQSGTTKTIYLDNISFYQGICIKDLEISSTSNISNDCNETNEQFVDCPGSRGNYNCTINGTRFKITGLNHSGVKQSNDTQAPVILSYSPATTTSTTTTLTITTDENSNCSYSTTPGTNYTDMANNFADSGTTHTALVSTSSSGTYNFYARCDDSYGNFNLNDYNAAITASISTQTITSSGGGGGGGGGGTSSVSEYEASKFYSIISPSTHLPMYINKERMAFTKISFSVEKTIKNARITVKTLNETEKPPVEIAGKAYQYLLVNLSEIKDEDIKNAEIELKVNKSWISSNGITEKDIYLNRYYGGWSKLPTEKIKETDKYIYYSSKTPGFSYFAITAEEIIKKEEAKTEERINESQIIKEEAIEEAVQEPVLPESEKQKGMPILSVILMAKISLVVIVFILGIKKVKRRHIHKIKKHIRKIYSKLR